jgi:hypothetical protein
MINIFTILLVIGFIIFIRNKNKEEFITVPPNDKMFELSKENKIIFDYKNKPSAIENRFLQEQEHGVNMNILYPNTWIDCIDSKGSGLPQWNSRENKTGIVNKIIQPRTLNSYNFNKEKISNMGGIIDPNDILYDETKGGNVGEKIKDIYDNSFVNFKNLIPNKTVISDIPNTQLMQAASDLQYLTPDTWIYENEKGENGGVMYTNKNTTVFASDPSTLGIVASF